MAEGSESFAWPEGVFTVAFSLKHMCGRRIIDLMGGNEKLESVIGILADQNITVLGHLLGKTPSEILPPQKISREEAELFYKAAGQYGIAPLSEIRKIDRSGGYSSFLFPGLEPP